MSSVGGLIFLLYIQAPGKVSFQGAVRLQVEAELSVLGDPDTGPIFSILLLLYSNLPKQYPSQTALLLYHLTILANTVLPIQELKVAMHDQERSEHCMPFYSLLYCEMIFCSNLYCQSVATY